MSTFTKCQWCEVAHNLIINGQLTDDEVEEIVLLLWDKLPQNFNTKVLRILEENK